MPLDIQYRCISCGSEEKDPNYGGMICGNGKCGGDRRPVGSLYGRANVFDEYYDRALQQRCSSYKDQEKKVKEFNETQRNLPPSERDPAHPEGFGFFNDDHKFVSELKYRKKHMEEFKKSQYPGYKPGTGKYNHEKPDEGRTRKARYFYGR